MIISNFLESLLPTVSKDTVRDDLNLSVEEFNQHVDPVYKQFEKNFQNYQFKNPTLNAFEKKLKNSDVQINYSGNWLVAIYKEAIKHTPEKIKLVQYMMDDNSKTADFVREAMKVREVNAVQLAEVLSFMVRYSRRLLNYAVTIETNYLKQEDENGRVLIAEVEWINKHYSPFLVGLAFLATKKAKATELIDKVPDILVNKANAQEVMAVASHTADPFRMGFIPLVLNPIYHVRMRIAEWQAARYHEAKFEQQALATKLMYLQKKAEGKDDAKLERTIEEYERLLAKKTYELHAMEEKYAQ